MNRLVFFTFSFSLFTFNLFAQHPSKFHYNLDKKEYSISAEEKSAIKSHITDWLKQHDTIIVKSGISDIRFTPDEMMLAECDSVGEKMSYYHEPFKGFPASDNGSFFGANIYIKNKQGAYDKYTINLSYTYDVVKIWNWAGTYYLKK
jgi:hypothetical protein